jgi:hypothetical protein
MDDPASPALSSHDDPPADPAAASPDSAEAGGAATIVRTVLSLGLHDPAAFRELLRAHPYARAEILGFLDSTLGGGFVQAVLGPTPSTG